ncbi:MAG TPA: S8 family serine peptidase [Capillimicrobium sp.]|nr:S8 family serine peptidase [Capillimicrobium sp.]
MRRAALAWLGILVGAVLASPSAALGEPTRDSYIVVLNEDAPPPAVAAAQATRLGGDVSGVYSEALDGYAAQLSAGELAQVRDAPGVDFVVPDRTFAQPDVVAAPVECDGPGDLGQCLPDGVDRIDADLSSAKAGDGGGSVDVDVAVIDSGIADHPDLHVAGGVGCQSGSPSSAPGDLGDPVGHGTAVAGVLAAEDNGIGVVGVAPGARLWSVRVAGDDGAIAWSSVLCAIDWVTGTRTDADPANDVAIANISLTGPAPEGDVAPCGAPDDDDPVHVAICRSVAAGVLYVAAAGNQFGDVQDRIPARYPQVLTVTAMADFDGAPGGAAPPVCQGEDLGGSGIHDDLGAIFSNVAVADADLQHTIAAPGVCIDTTIAPQDGGPSYGNLSGTSFASPHIAGLAALCVASGRCSGQPLADLSRLLADAEATNRADPAYGFRGDPLRPFDFGAFGWLPSAALD